MDLLERLTDRERERLLSIAVPVRLGPGDYLIRRGEQGGDLFRVLEGELEVVDRNSQPPVILDVIPKGGMVGELGFLDQRMRSADVRSSEGAICLRLDKRSVDRLLGEDPFLAAAFFRALANMLAERLRATSTQVGVAERSRDHTDDQTGRELARRACGRLAEMEPLFRRDRQAGRTEATTILHAFAQELSDVVERLPESEALAVGRAAAAELHPYLSRSHLGELAMDHQLFPALLHIDSARPQGDGPLGEVIDEWLLNLRTCRALRERRAETAELILENLPSEPPLRMMLVNVGSGALVRTVVDDLGRLGGELLCVDDQREALEHLQRELSARPRSLRLRLELRDAWELVTGAARVPHGALHLLVIDGLLDSLPEQVAASLLEWARAQLGPAGLLIVTALAPSPDDAIFRHLLEWPLIRRRPAMLTHLMEAAGLEVLRVHEDRGTSLGLLAVGRATSPSSSPNPPSAP